MPGGNRSTRRNRLLWFAGLWLAGILAVATLAGMLKYILGT